MNNIYIWQNKPFSQKSPVTNVFVFRKNVNNVVQIIKKYKLHNVIDVRNDRDKLA